MNNFLKKIDIKKAFFSFYWLLLLLVIIDQATKVIFLTLEARMGPGYHLVIIDNFFYFSYYRNTGAAWSILEDYPWVLALISLVASLAMISYRIIKAKSLNNYHKAAWALVIAGTFGNFIDRAFYKALTGIAGVVDFLHFQFGDYHFPIFNVADMCLVIGIIGMVVLTLFEDIRQKKNLETTKSESSNDQQ